MMERVLLMVALGGLLAAGLGLSLFWVRRPYHAWRGSGDDGSLDAELTGVDGGASARQAALRYGRGLALALTGGFWAGALVTGPSVRLAMRLLAVTAGSDAQGKVTEAEEVVGDITLEGTVGLYAFGGIVPGLMSGAIYVVVRRWLPRQPVGGVVFGALHLVIAATRVDPLRPENRDFDLVGPGWLAVLAFGGACIAHGIAVAAFVNRYSEVLPGRIGGRRAVATAVVPLAVPAVLVLINIFLLVPILFGLAIAVALLSADGAARLARARGVDIAGRVVLGAVAAVATPGAARALADIVFRG